MQEKLGQKKWPSYGRTHINLCFKNGQIMVASTIDSSESLPASADSPEAMVNHELAKKQPTLKSIVEAFRAAVKAQHRFEDPALRYVRSLDSEQSQRQALHALTWWLANYPWDASPDEMTNYWSQLTADSINTVRAASLAGDPDTGEGKLAAATAQLISRIPLMQFCVSSE